MTLVVVLFVVVLVFGATSPALGDALGKGIRNFKKARVEDARSTSRRAPRGSSERGGAARPRATRAARRRA